MSNDNTPVGPKTQQEHIDAVSEVIRRSLSGFIGDPISQESMGRMAEAVDASLVASLSVLSLTSVGELRSVGFRVPYPVPDDVIVDLAAATISHSGIAEDRFTATVDIPVCAFWPESSDETKEE